MRGSSTFCTTVRRGNDGRQESAVKAKLMVAGLLTAALIAPAQGYAATQVTGLEADAASTPLGIDDATPRLSWRLTSDERAVTQSGYRVVVATTAAKAAAGQGDVWDSGGVDSSDPFAEYAGPALAARTRYYWSVRALPASGWAEPTWFETAYLDSSQWKGDWISGPARIERKLTYNEGAADDACCQQGATTLTGAVAAGARNVKVAAVNAFTQGSTVTLENETPTIASVGTPTTRTTLGAAATAGATSLRVNDITWIRVGDTLTVDAEPVTVTALTPSNFGASTVTIAAPLAQAHANAAPVFDAGTGVTFTAPLAAAHASGAALTQTNLASDFCRPPGTGFGPMYEGNCREIRPEPLLRKSFTVDSAHGAVVKARLYSSGLAYNNVELNGARTSDRVLAPGFTRYTKTVEYTTDDVASLIHPGENVLATRLGSGQYDDETTSNDWHWEDAEWRGTPRLRADLYVTYADGTEQVIHSDDSWKAGLGPTRFDAYYLGETYDARRAIAGWSAPGFDAGTWSPARTVAAPTGTLRAMTEEPTKVVANHPAGTRTSPRPGVFVYDTGLQRAGWATIKVSGAPAGTPIQILYAEKLNPDGTVTNAGFTAVGQIQTDYYIADGTGTPEHPEVFQPQFTYKGFQYIQVSAPSDPASTQAGSGTPQPLAQGTSVTVDSVQEVRQDLATTGTFSAGASLLEKIHQTTLASLHENYVASIITDTAYEAKIAADTARTLGNSADAAHFDALFDDIKADFNAKWWDADRGFYAENSEQILAQTFQAVALAFDLVPAD